MVFHLVEGTYELFRHFYGLRRFNKGVDRFRDEHDASGSMLKSWLHVLEYLVDRISDIRTVG
jgi:hypothetical protein